MKFLICVISDISKKKTKTNNDDDDDDDGKANFEP